MSKKEFIPSDWLPTENIPENRRDALPCVSDFAQPAIQVEIETIISRIESQQIDITANYADWRDVGFAFADAFGETGRDYYHRISRFYPNYSASECDKQFDNCLKAKGTGITIKTFFHLAEQAGFDIKTTVSDSSRV